jgi:glycosyltransferase involved in cell wall biosynthesis
VVPGGVELRVLHVPDAVGGQAAGLARAERAVGLESVSVALEPSPFGYEMDETIARPGRSRLSFERERLKLVVRALRDFDVIHFNFGRTILPPPARGPAGFRYRAYARLLGLRDLALLDRAGKTIAVTFQGDDVRQGDVLRRRYAFSVADANPANYQTAADAAKRRIAAAFDRHADLIFFLNPDLGWVLPARARFLPYASVDPQEWMPQPPRHSERPLVVHAPSDRLTKGTEHVLAAVDQLRADGVPFDFRLVEGLSHAEARRLYEDADVFVDQLVVGWYGAAAVEAMALGKPVVCFLREEDFAHLPAELAADIPIVNADRATLTDRLRVLLEGSPDARAALGARGREYVLRWHDPTAIATGLASLYRDPLQSGHRTSDLHSNRG